MAHAAKTASTSAQPVGCPRASVWIRPFGGRPGIAVNRAERPCAALQIPKRMGRGGVPTHCAGIRGKLQENIFYSSYIQPDKRTSGTVVSREFYVIHIFSSH